MCQDSDKEYIVPVVTIKPKSRQVEVWLTSQMTRIRIELKQVICDVSGFPENDVLVGLDHCTTADPDPDAVDFIVFADTCPHPELEKRADELNEKIAMKLAELGLTVGGGAEVWVRFLPGSWCGIKYDKIYDSVSHKR